MLVSNAFGTNNENNPYGTKTPYRSLHERRLMAEAAAASKRKSLRDKRRVRYLGLITTIAFLSLYTSFDMLSHHDSTSRFLKKVGLALPGMTMEGKSYIEGTTFENLRDVKDTTYHPEDIPLFFLVPKSATSTLKSILGHCLHLHQASSSNAVEYEKTPGDIKELQLVQVNNGNGGSFLNVNFAWPDGIQRAKELDLASSGLVDVVVTSYVYEASDLFNDEHKGRLFTILRHPIKRMVSDYYYMQNAKWENLYESDEDRPKSIMEYAQNPKHHVDNFLTRFLSGNRSRKVTLEDYELAKEVLATKALILVQDKMEESVDRLLSYFHWNEKFVSNHDDAAVSGAEKCIDGYINAPVNTNEHEELEPGSEEWEALRLITDWDIHLYWYGIELWENQGKALFREKLNANGFREHGKASSSSDTTEEDEELLKEEEIYLEGMEESEAEWYAKKKKEQQERGQHYSKKIDSVFEEEDKEIDEKKKMVAVMMQSLSLQDSNGVKDNKEGKNESSSSPKTVVEYVSWKEQPKPWFNFLA